MRKVVCLILALAVGLVFGISVASATDVGPAQIVLQAPKAKAFGTKIIFNHKEHQKVSKCGECHHGENHSPYKEGMKIEKCDQCHNKNFPKASLNSAKKAFHKNCIGCHRAAKKEGKKAPTKCKECHTK